MQHQEWRTLSGLCVLALSSLWPLAGLAQPADSKEKPPLYTYVSNWAVPRARWADMEKQDAADVKIFDKALGNGLVGYGSDRVLVHEADGDTHDSFWSATSVAGVLGVLDELYKQGASTAQVLGSSTKHSDQLFISRFYNWKSGSVKDGYTHGASYKLKPEAPDDAVATLSKAFIVPLLEKALADGTILEYEIDTEWVHTEAPGKFWVFYITPTAAGLDKISAALGEALKASPLAGPALDSMADGTAHHDYLARTNATYK